jgi:cbb3-type cytochrome oxidase maturation protein
LGGRVDAAQLPDRSYLGPGLHSRKGDEKVNIVWFLLPIALLMGCGFLAAFITAAKSGQYDDLETPAHRMLLEDRTSIDAPALKGKIYES